MILFSSKHQGRNQWPPVADLHQYVWSWVLLLPGSLALLLCSILHLQPWRGHPHLSQVQEDSGKIQRRTLKPGITNVDSTFWPFFVCNLMLNSCCFECRKIINSLPLHYQCVILLVKAGFGLHNVRLDLAIKTIKPQNNGLALILLISIAIAIGFIRCSW